MSEPLAAAFGIALDDPDAPRRRWGNNINPDGTVYELTKVDPHDFRDLAGVSFADE